MKIQMKYNQPIKHRFMKNKRFYNFVLVSLVYSGLMGCSSVANITHKDNTKKPAKLISIENPVDVLQPVLDVDIGGARVAKKDPLKLEPVFDGRKVYSASRAGEVNAMLLSAVRLWLVDVQDEITGGVAYDGVTQTVIVSTNDGEIVALSGKDGSLRWKKQLPSTVLSPAVISADYQRVMVSANNGTFYGLDLSSGQLVWQFASSIPKMSVRGTAKPKLLDSETASFSGADGRIYALDIDTGKPKWSHRIAQAKGTSEVERMMDLDGSAVISEGHLYSTSYTGQLVAIDLKRHKSVYFDKVASLHEPVVTEKFVVVSDLKGNVIAYDKNTGKQSWKNSELHLRKLTNPVELNNHIAIGDYDGVVHLLDKNTGEIVSRVNTEGALNYLQVIGNKLITQSTTGHIAIWQW